jgi:hypothetical protein
MKLKDAYLFFVCLSIAAISCTRVVFLHPAFINNSNRVFKSELLGKWIDTTEDSGIVVTIDTARNYDSSVIYKISLIGKTDSNFGDSSYMDGELLNFSGKLFMMISSDFDHPKNKQIGLYNAAMIPQTYHFIRIFSISKDSIQMGEIDADTLAELLDKKKISLKHDIAEEDIFILERGNNIGKKLIELEKFPGIYIKSTYRRLE